jgi:hypothetical protein
MRVLETKREAAERRRAALMSRGIAQFLDLAANETEDFENRLDAAISSQTISRSQSPCRPTGQAEEEESSKEGQENKTTAVLDNIKQTLDRAASILRESLDLPRGGVVFLDTSLGYSEGSAPDDYFNINPEPLEEQAIGQDMKDHLAADIKLPQPSTSSITRDGVSPGQVRRHNDGQRSANILAMCATAVTPGSSLVDGKTLQDLCKNYPKGNVWYIDEKGFFSSLEQANELQPIDQRVSPFERRRSISSTSSLKRQKKEAEYLSKVFHNARQIIFLPLWDVAASKSSSTEH